MSGNDDRGERASRGGRVRVLEGQLSPSAAPPARLAGGRRYRLRASAEPVVAADGALMIARAGEPDLRIRGADAADRRLLERLADDAATAAELALELRLSAEAVEAKLAALRAAGVLLDVADSPPLAAADAERYARQLPWLAEFGDERALQRDLMRARVTVIGCGGLGTWTLAGLLAAGVRHLRLIDDDRVALSNLNRQVLYDPGDLGTPKVRAAAAWLRAYDPRAEVESRCERVDSPAAAAAAVAGADAVALLADEPPYALARWVNAACLVAGVPFITAGQLPPLLRVGPLYRPGATACFTCHERLLRRTSADYDAYVRRIATAPARGATLGPASGIAGTLVASELVQLLIGADPASAGAALLLDLRTLAVRREPVPRDSGCPDCQHLR